jgi:hypothetical protein
MKTVATILAIAAVGCASAEPAPEPEPGTIALGATCTDPSCPGFHQSMEIITTGTCDLRRNRLRNCDIPDGSIFPPAIDSAVPLRTLIRPIKSGACSTSYPLELAVSSPQLADSHKLRYLESGTLTLRADGGAPLTELALVDESPWTPIASFAMPCSITAEIVVNQPDVDSATEAQAILDGIQLALEQALAQRDAYEQLLLFLSAHDFLRAVVDNLYGELTNDMMQELRAQAQQAMPAFSALAGSQACASELGDDAFTLLNLAGALFVLGDPADWQNPDGTTKTLADMYTEYSGDGVVAQIQALADAASPALEEQYQDAYDAAALSVAQLEADLALAQTQLAYWL